MTIEVQQIPIGLDDVISPIVRAGIIYWRGLLGSRAFPSRSQVAPSGMRGCLRNALLVRVIGDSDDFEYRIIGDAHIEAFGQRLPNVTTRMGTFLQGSSSAVLPLPKTLKGVDDLFPGYSDILMPLYDRVVRKRAPHAMQGRIRSGITFPPYVDSENVFLPLGPSDEIVDHVLNFSVYRPST